MSAAVSADSSVALTGGEDGSLRLTSLVAGKVAGKLDGHTGSVEAAALPAQVPGTAVTCSMDGRLVVWDINSRSVRLECEHPEVCVCVSGCVRRHEDGAACMCVCVWVGACVAVPRKEHKRRAG